MEDTTRSLDGRLSPGLGRRSGSNVSFHMASMPHQATAESLPSPLPIFRKGSSSEQPRKKFEPGGMSAKGMPCPSCKGQGYLLCPRCNSKNLEASCSHCSGRGYHDCPLCHGKCVVWEDSLSESTWASLHSRSPVQIAEDDAIESMTISPTAKRDTKRVYGPLPPETREKISRALKDLEARTGSLSQRVKGYHQDPVLRAQRTAAIKKARGTDEARKRTSEKLKEYFKSPENRLKKSQSMKGVRFSCAYCGEKGHRRHFCPKLGYKNSRREPIRAYHCSNCGQIGHRCSQCSEKPKLGSSPLVTITGPSEENAEQGRPGVYQCKLCQTIGHSKRTCPKLKRSKRLCSICDQAGHNRRTCPAAAPK